MESAYVGVTKKVTCKTVHNPLLQNLALPSTSAYLSMSQVVKKEAHHPELAGQQERIYVAATVEIYLQSVGLVGAADDQAHLARGWLVTRSCCQMYGRQSCAC